MIQSIRRLLSQVLSCLVMVPQKTFKVLKYWFCRQFFLKSGASLENSRHNYVVFVILAAFHLRCFNLPQEDCPSHPKLDLNTLLLSKCYPEHVQRSVAPTWLRAPEGSRGLAAHQLGAGGRRDVGRWHASHGLGWSGAECGDDLRGRFPRQGRVGHVCF